MTIGIDIDDTISDTTEQIDVCAKEFTEKILSRQFSIKKDNIQDPMWAKIAYNWTIEEDSTFWNLYYSKIVKSVEPKENAIDTINELYKKHTIILISARKDDEEINKLTKEWLQKYNLHYHKLYTGHIDKRTVVKENNINLFIDDSIRTCNEINDLGIKTYLMTSRRNKTFKSKDSIIVNSWKEIYEKIINL